MKETATPVNCLGYVGLSVRSLAAWDRFAANVLGLQTDRDATGVLRLRMDSHLYRFALHEGDADDIAYLGLEVSDAIALDNVERHLRDIGVAVRSGDSSLAATRQVIGIIQFDGPDGILYEVYYGPTIADAPFRSPGFASGFITGLQGLGHAVLFTQNIDASLRFVAELGFRLSDRIDVTRNGAVQSAYFLHCNERHHSIALTPAPPGSARRLHHIMIEAKSLDDVGHAMDAAVEHGVEIRATLGRHTNDAMVSFYMKSPSGFDIEYGWGSAEFEPRGWSARRYDRTSIWGHRHTPQTN